MLATPPSQFGTAVVLVTHEPRFASYADRVIFLRDGIIVDETPRAVPDTSAALARSADGPVAMALGLAARPARGAAAPRRTLLVVFLVAVPVFGMTVGSVLVRTADAGGDWVTPLVATRDGHRRRAAARCSCGPQ